MNEPIDYATTRDPLYRDVPLEHEARLPVLGIPVRFTSNAAAVIDAAEAAFGSWRRLDPATVEGDEVRVRIVVQPGDEGGAEHARLYHRILGSHRVLFASPGSVGIVDPARREAVAYVSEALATDREHFRYGVVEAMTMALVTPFDRQPFHAACVARDGAALLLAGPSGVGKSTLTYTALRSLDGVSVLADDTVFLQARPRLRVWGLPGFLHLPADAQARFPELDRLDSTLLANGKTKLALDLRAAGDTPASPVVDRASLCLLRRNDGRRPGVRPLAPRELLDRLTAAAAEPGFDLFADTIREPLTLIAAEGGWELELAEDPRDAVPWLASMLEQASASAA